VVFKALQLVIPVIKTHQLTGVSPMAQAIGGAIGVAKTLLDRIKQLLIAGAKPGPEAFA
jgi:hypothetical protein